MIVRSQYLPRLLGVGLQLAGACYIIESFALILYPSLAPKLGPAILLPPFLAELSTALWFLIKGVSLPNWRERQMAPAAN